MKPDTTTDTPIFYVYTHAKPDGTVFYVGKGKGNRYKVLYGRNSYHQRIIEKHGADNIHTSIIQDGLLEDEAFALEIAVINLFQANGHKLANISSGGKGATGVRHTPEFKERMRLMMLERNADEAFREANTERLRKITREPAFKSNTSERTRKMWEDTDYRERMINAIAESWRDPSANRERVRKISEAYSAERKAEQSVRTKRLNQDPQVRANQTAGQVKLWADPEYRETRHRQHKELYTNPATRDEIIQKCKEAQNRPDVKAAKSAASRALYNDAAYKAKVVARLIAQNKDPAHRKRRGEAIKRAISNPLHKMKIAIGNATRSNRPYSSLTRLAYPWVVEGCQLPHK